MKPHITNAFNGAVFIMAGIWAYFDSYPQSYIPIIIGIGLISLTQGIIKENKVLGFLAMGGTFVLCFVLGTFLFKNLNTEDTNHLVRLVLVFLSSIFSMFFFIKCFMNSKKNAACCVQPADGSACCDKTQTQEVNAKQTGCC